MTAPSSSAVSIVVIGTGQSGKTLLLKALHFYSTHDCQFWTVGQMPANSEQAAPSIELRWTGDEFGEFDRDSRNR